MILFYFMWIDISIGKIGLKTNAKFAKIDLYLIMNHKT